MSELLRLLVLRVVDRAREWVREGPRVEFRREIRFDPLERRARWVMDDSRREVFMSTRSKMRVT